ncbi:hypothetical protein [Agreia sp. Leaf210]|uniref:hypothetical protein n=1 Tax=Agreia sp. Leaf210 TaxID=1735682 RepID=UPI000A77D2EA|nr:hypothetical protein [Agreia sp. Leaf210]
MRRGSRIVALMLGVTLVAGWGASHLEHTEAAWSDRETANATLVAMTIPKPVVQSCVLTSGLLGANPVVTVKWNFPAGTGYVVPANVAYGVSEGAVLSNVTVALLGQGVTTSGPAAGTYTTTFSGSLLGGLLGGSYGLYLQTADGTGWRSAWSGSTASMGLLGANPTCSPNPV